MRAILLMLATLLATTSIEAQGTTQDPRNNRKARIREKVEAMRKAMREGRIVRYNVKVKVRLKLKPSRKSPSDQSRSPPGA